MNDIDLSDACDYELEAVSEGNVFEDGLCKFVSQFLSKYKLSTGVTVFEEETEVESFVPKNDCCLAGLTEACEDEPEPVEPEPVEPEPVVPDPIPEDAICFTE